MANVDNLIYRDAEQRKLRMDAYYYGFTQTGVEAIDRILAAVATAGKRYHHTEYWGDASDEVHDPVDGTPQEWIQEMADQAAREWRRKVD